MAILIDEKKRVLIQGITGREGRARARLMREYGTNVVAGVTPGKGGQDVLGVPVFNTPQDAVNSLGTIDISVLFVPAAGVKDAAFPAHWDPKLRIPRGQVVAAASIVSPKY